MSVRPPTLDTGLDLLLGLLVGQESRSVEDQLVDGEVGLLSATEVLLDVLARELDLRRVCEKAEVWVSGSCSAVREERGGEEGGENMRDA